MTGKFIIMKDVSILPGKALQRQIIVKERELADLLHEALSFADYLVVSMMYLAGVLIAFLITHTTAISTWSSQNLHCFISDRGYNRP